MRQIILPKQTIGIIGGGQLGLMIAIQAKQMGYHVITLDPNLDAPAAMISDSMILGSFDDADKLELLCSSCDVITYEFENINHEIIGLLEQKYNILPNAKTLKLSQHRLTEKQFIESLNIKTVPYLKINNLEELINGLNTLGYPSVLKTCRFGYDGKGQIVVRNENDIQKTYDILNTKDCILESFIDFDQEVSLVLTRGMHDLVTFPIPHNIHINNILHQSIVPSNLSEDMRLEINRIGALIANNLDYIGTMAIEFFIKDEQIYFNEMAPRPHNSGHYTIEGCNKSQFRTHIEAICGLRLGEITLKQPTTMVNILGQHLEHAINYIGQDIYHNASLHLYGKNESKINRKMGHITFYSDTKENVASNVDKYLGGNYE